ncbi:MAG: hypothetical protein R3E79_33480 [Caldilineaceae bacterium]
MSAIAASNNASRKKQVGAVRPEGSRCYGKFLRRIKNGLAQPDPPPTQAEMVLIPYAYR